MLCDDLEGWHEGAEGRLRQEGIYEYIQLIHFAVEQKLPNIVKQLYASKNEKRSFILSVVGDAFVFLFGVSWSLLNSR